MRVKGCYSGHIHFQCRWHTTTIKSLLKEGKDYWYWAADWVFAPRYAPTWKNSPFMCVKTPHGRIPSLRDSVQHVLRKCICYWQAPSSGQTWRLHDSGFGCQIVPCAWERRSLFSGIVHQGATKSPPVLGTTADLGHFGATNRTDSFSALILQSMQAEVSLEERHTCVLSASCELVHPLPEESVSVNKTAGSECSPPMQRDPPTVKTQTWQLLLRGAWWAHTAERADFFSGSSLARLWCWVQLSSSERQHQECGFDSSAAGLPFLSGRGLWAFGPWWHFGHGCLDLTAGSCSRRTAAGEACGLPTGGSLTYPTCQLRLKKTWGRISDYAPDLWEACSTTSLSHHASRGRRGWVSGGRLFGHDPTGGTTRTDGFWPARQEAPTQNRAHPLPWTGRLGARHHCDAGPPRRCHGAQCNPAGCWTTPLSQTLPPKLHHRPLQCPPWHRNTHHILSVRGGAEISGHEAHWKGTCSRVLGVHGHWAGAGSSPDLDRSASETCGTFLLGSKEAAEEEHGRAIWASSSPWTMATRSVRVLRLISPQWGQSDPSSTASARARTRQMTHDSWPSEDSIGSIQERLSRVIFVWIRSSPEHGRGRESVSAAACRSRWVVIFW